MCSHAPTFEEAKAAFKAAYLGCQTTDTGKRALAD
jgi:hypothetical protein